MNTIKQFSTLIKHNLWSIEVFNTKALHGLICYGTTLGSKQTSMWSMLIKKISNIDILFWLLCKG